MHKGIQRYKCAACGRVFLDTKRLNPQAIWIEYTQGKKTYLQLDTKYQCCIKTIQRKIDAISVESETIFSSVANVLMDITYFGRAFGVMVFKNSINGQILLKRYVKQETNEA